MENQMLGTKITRPRVGQYKNNSPKRWEAQNNSPKGWTDGESNGQHENNSPKDGNQMVGTKITHPKVGWYKNNSPKR